MTLPPPATWLAPAAIAAVLLLLAALLFRLTRKPWHARIRRKAILTPNEREFFHRLQRALPGHLVLPQVAFAAFITDDGALSGRARWSVRARFDRKMADYVICTRDTLEVVALVELDDRTHSAQADRQRDAITKSAGYQTIRFQSRKKPSEADISALFKHARAWQDAKAS